MKLPTINLGFVDRLAMLQALSLAVASGATFVFLTMSSGGDRELVIPIKDNPRGIRYDLGHTDPGQPVTIALDLADIKAMVRETEGETLKMTVMGPIRGELLVIEDGTSLIQTTPSYHAFQRIAERPQNALRSRRDGNLGATLGGGPGSR